MAKEVFNRYEVKYMLSTDQKDAVIEVLLDQMNLDPYNSGGKYYTICNIYYDTEDNTLIQRSLSRPPYKEKLRLRGYGVPKPGDIVFLEINQELAAILKLSELGNVDWNVLLGRSCIELEEAKRYMETGVLPEFQPYMNRQVLREIDYFTHIYDLKPKLYLAYDRLAFFDKSDSGFRVSFDTNIRTRRYDLSLDAGDHGQKMLKDDLWLMEVKIDKNLPLWFAHLLQENKMYNSSFSKYGTEYARMIASERMENADMVYSSII